MRDDILAARRPTSRHTNRPVEKQTVRIVPRLTPTPLTSSFSATARPPSLSAPRSCARSSDASTPSPSRALMHLSSLIRDSFLPSPSSTLSILATFSRVPSSARAHDASWCSSSSVCEFETTNAPAAGFRNGSVDLSARRAGTVVDTRSVAEVVRRARASRIESGDSCEDKSAWSVSIPSMISRRAFTSWVMRPI